MMKGIEMSDITTTLSKRLDASPEAVFDAWTDPEGMGAWFSPMTTASVPKLDLRVGGDFQIDMHGEDMDFVHTGRYLEIDRPRKLAFTWISGGTQDQETVVTLNLEADGDGTLLTLTHERFPNTESRDNHAKGWAAIMEKFVGVCAGE
jgi:uncharacterized protein YndB with AHSA1/START domain